MSRKEAIKCLEVELRIWESDCKSKHVVKDALKMAIKALEQESKWIPVSERLPKAGEYIGDVAKYYLVQNEYGDMLVARYTHSEYWEQIYQLKPIVDEIVAWMPLPKAYKTGVRKYEQRKTDTGI
jgi:hypothetical protein